jgi:glycosyltransferase involved in cell wall biosynthesis
MKCGPQVSVIVATLHARDWLKRVCDDYGRIKSLGVELVVVDGGSNDGSMQIVQATPGACWNSEPDDGVADAWNTALKIASGDWIVFAGADDRLAPVDTWRRVVAELTAVSPHVGLVAFPVEVISPEGSPLYLAIPHPGRNFSRLKAVNAVPHQGLFVRREAFNRIGQFDTSLGVVADYEWVLRAVLAGESIELRAEASPVRMTFGGVSTHDPLRTACELRLAQAKLGVRGVRLAWWAAWGRACIRALVQRAVGRTSAGRLADVGRRLRGLKPVWSVR